MKWHFYDLLNKATSISIVAAGNMNISVDATIETSGYGPLDGPGAPIDIGNGGRCASFIIMFFA